MVKAKVEPTPEQVAAKEMADLQKSAKKLKIQFDAETTVDELKMLVKAGEDALAAQKAKDAEEQSTTPPAETKTDAPEAGKDEPVVTPPPLDSTPGAEPEGTLPEKDVVLQSLTTRNKETFHLVRTPATKKADGKVQLKTRFGQVVAEFDGEAQGKAHMENLSRF